jgi:hypothetical protein
MTGTETESASKQWGIWFTARLKAKSWSVDSFVAATDGEVSRTQAYRWYRGEQVPTRENAALVADTLGVDRRQAYMASGHEIDPDTPIIADPAEAFVQAIRARGFPPAVEERLIAEIRAEIERRRQSLEDQLNTVAFAMEEKVDEP